MCFDEITGGRGAPATTSTASDRGVPGASRLDSIRPGPGIEPDREEEFRDRMSDLSPDGRPPTQPARSGARTLFLVLLVLVAAGVITSLWMAGGWVPAAVASVIALMSIAFAAWPAWHAGVDRALEEHRERVAMEDEAAQRHAR